MPPVYRDINVDVRLEPYGRNIPVQATSIECDLTRFDEAAVVEIDGLTPDGLQSPAPVAGTQVSVAVSTSGPDPDYTGPGPDHNATDRPGTLDGANMTLVKVARIDDIGKRGDGSFKLTAYDFHRHLNNNKISIQFSGGGGTPVNLALDRTFSNAGYLPPRYNIDTPYTGEGVRSDPGSGTVAGPEDGTGSGPTGPVITQDFTNTPVSSIIDKICKKQNLIWYVDRQNNAQITDTPPSDAIDLTWINGGTDAGEDEVAYQRVVVYGSSGRPPGGVGEGDEQAQQGDGSGPGSPESPNASEPHWLGKRAVVGAAETEDFEENDPVYVTRDPSAKTVTQAQNIALSILDEFLRDSKSGPIKTPGVPMLQPLDVVGKPDDPQNPDAGRTDYLVSSVTHTIDSNGYVTEIDTGGILDQRVTNDDGSSPGGSGGGTGNQQTGKLVSRGPAGGAF